MMTFDDTDACWSLNEASDRHAHASAPGRRLAAGQGEVRALGRTSSATAQNPSSIPPAHTLSARRSLNNLMGFIAIKWWASGLQHQSPHKHIRSCKIQSVQSSWGS